jgi:hypothetical protein
MITYIYLIEKLTLVTEEPNEWGKMGVQRSNWGLNCSKLLKNIEALFKTKQPSDTLRRPPLAG